MAFLTRYYNYEFLVKSFGLTNSPANCVDVMNRVFRDYLDSFVIVFVDYILVHYKIQDERMDHLGVVL